MAGRNEAQRLQDGGIDASKPSHTSVPIDDVVFAPEGDALAHPRANFPIRRSLVDSMKQGFDWRFPFTVRERGVVNGKMRLDIIDGSQRKIHGAIAQAELRAEGKLPLRAEGDDRYYVAIKIFNGTDLECLAERLRLNSDPDKLPDSPSVLFATFHAMHRLGASVELIAKVAPRDIDIAALLRWPSLTTPVRDRLDLGDLPLCLIDALADLPPELQEPTLGTLIEQDALTPRKARKVVRGITHPNAARFRPVPPKVVDRVVGHVIAATDRDSQVAAGVLRWQTGDITTLADVAPELLGRLEAAKLPPPKPGRKDKGKGHTEEVQP